MIIKLADVMEDIQQIKEHGLPQGFSTGWEEVDKHFRPEKGYFCVLTGIPGHGKSEFFDCLAVNTSWMHGWRWGIFSPENYPIALHYNKMVEKILGMSISRAPESEYDLALEFIDDHMTWMYPEDGEDYNLNQVLAEIKQVKDVYGIDAFVIDPWNEIDHSRPDGMTETEYIDKALRHIRRFCRENELFGVVIAHPTKLYPNREGVMPPVTLWTISGSAAWRNKADYGLVVSREDVKKNEPVLDVQKIKQKNFGKVGEVPMHYDRESGRMKSDLAGSYLLPKRFMP